MTSVKTGDIEFIDYVCDLGVKAISKRTDKDGNMVPYESKYYVEWQFISGVSNPDDLIKSIEANCTCTAEVKLKTYKKLPQTDKYLGVIGGIFTPATTIGDQTKYVVVYLKQEEEQFITNEFDVKVVNPDAIQPVLLTIQIKQV